MASDAAEVEVVTRIIEQFSVQTPPTLARLCIAALDARRADVAEAQIPKLCVHTLAYLRHKAAQHAGEEGK